MRLGSFFTKLRDTNVFTNDKRSQRFRPCHVTSPNRSLLFSQICLTTHICHGDGGNYYAVSLNFILHEHEHGYLNLSHSLVKHGLGITLFAF